MPDLTIQIVVTAPSHAVSGTSNKAASRLRRGDIVGVYPSGSLATLDGNGDYITNGGIGATRLGFIHIKNIPAARADNFASRMAKSTGEQAVQFIHDPVTGGTEPHTHNDAFRKRKWRFQIPQLAVPKRNALINNREITLNWPAARDKIVRKIVSNRTDPDSDTDTPVLDGDLD